MVARPAGRRVFLLLFGVLATLLPVPRAGGAVEGAGGIKGQMFFPNHEAKGLEGFDLGFGIGVEGRFTLLPMIALSPQVGFTQSSGSRTVGGVPFTAVYDDVPIQVNAFFTPPLEAFDLYVGGGGSYHFTRLWWTGPSDSDSAAGWGWQAKAGIGHSVGVGNLYLEGEWSASTVHFSNPSGKFTTRFGRSDADLMGGGASLFFGYKIGF